MRQKRNKEFIILGHRGCIGVDGIGENTIPAFIRALQDGADGIELDVYVARDAKGADHLIVMHDDDVSRTTNGKGKVWELGYERLRELKVGDEKTERVEQYEEAVPTAAEVLDAVLEFNAVTGKHSIVNIELKGKATAAPTAELITTYLNRGFRPDDFIVSSFDHPQLIEFHKVLPQVKTAVLIDNKQFAAAGNSFEPAIHLAQQLHSVAVNPGIAFTNADDIARFHEDGLKVYVWTGASQEMVDKANEHVVQIYQLGADGAFANNPGSGRKAFNII